MAKQWPILYKRTTTGKIQQWQIFAEDGHYWSVNGQVDGKLIISAKTKTKPKNVGRSNASTAEHQAEVEAQSKFKKKLESEYYEDINEVDDARAEGRLRPMKAKIYADYCDEIIFPCYSQPKLDGVRCLVTKDGLFSINWKPYPMAAHIFRFLQPFLGGKSKIVAFDGELYNHAYKSNFQDFIKLIGIKKPTEEDLKRGEKDIEFHIFDCITADNLPNSKRIELLTEMFESRTLKKPCVMVTTIKHKNQTGLDLVYNSYLDQGYEGQMIRTADAEYQHQRTNTLLKRKEFMDAEFDIIDFIEGRGKLEGKAGKIVIRIKDELTSEAGMTGTMEFRRDVFKNKHKYIGKKQATIKFQGYTGDGRLRFGTFVAFRDYE